MYTHNLNLAFTHLILQQNSDLEALLNQLRESQDRIDSNQQSETAPDQIYSSTTRAKPTSDAPDAASSTGPVVPSQAQLDSLLHTLQAQQPRSRDLTALSYAESLPVVQSLCLDEQFVKRVKAVREQQHAFEAKLRDERNELQVELKRKGVRWVPTAIGGRGSFV